jgi:hypothetical protein
MGWDMWGLFADLVILLHAAWALFLALGFIFALRKSKIAFVHLGGLGFSFILNLQGWYCPLTHLENFLRSLHSPEATYSSSFMMAYVYRFLYPDLPEGLLRIGEIVFVCLNLAGYAYIAKRDHLFRRIKAFGQEAP